MIFGFTILATALLLSLVAAYYSIMGLTAIFAAATIPVIIMGASLELGKIVATVWLHNNWSRASWLFKTYLIPAVFFLMLLTRRWTNDVPLPLSPGFPETASDGACRRRNAGISYRSAGCSTDPGITRLLDILRKRGAS